MLPQCFPLIPIRGTLFPEANYAYATQQRILTKIRACEQLQNFCEHEQASTHLIFASNSSKGQILRALSNWMGPFYALSSSLQWIINFPAQIFLSAVDLIWIMWSMPAKTESCFEVRFERSLEFMSSCFMLLFSVFTTFYETNLAYHISQVSDDVFLTK